MEFEDILNEVGSYGRFQRNLIYFFTLPALILAPFFHMNLIFIVAVPNHWCKVPNVVNSNLSTTQQRNLVEFYENPQCLMNDWNYSEILISEYQNISYNEGVSCKYGWEYDKTDFEATAATKWDMVCNNNHYPSLMLTLQNIGALIGTPIYGFVADRWGRKLAFFIAVLFVSTSEILSVLTSNLIFFAFLKIVNGAHMPIIIILPCILVSEMVAPDKRVLNNGVANCAWMIGMCIMPLVVYLSRSWITVGVINASAGLLVLMLWRIVPESPSWLISRERYDEAFEIMMRIGIQNKKIPDEMVLLKKLRTMGDTMKRKKETEEQNFYAIIVQYPRLRKIFCILTFCWIATIYAYNGLQYNVTELEGNVFLNFFLLSIVEAPGNILFWILMERVGRRWSASLGFIATGLVCLISVTGLPYSQTVGSILGKLIISGVFMVSDQQGCELYPTVCRSFGIGMGKTFSKASSLLLPYVIYLGKYGKSIPYIVISLVCITAGILATFLPESLDENLPQNISDMEEFGKNQKFFSFNRKKRLSNSSASFPDKDFDGDGQPAIFVISTTEAAN